MYAHARVDDLDLDARSQWIGKGTKISVELSRQLSKQKELLHLLQQYPFFF